ncbi:hypothetical protein [Halobaculum gomorrense]|uniref:DUF7993 domain-containing protein n=1 Tax=Halobaculum gomorrense TaxID=43928 RepID=A0A1M5KRD4_9EURY|nr:hypothetical protein [Halobaculum gomorrense]SHG55295.1 hypothetical protein SAMN05443636_0613 [Halobaculum gomorrense]
MVDDQTTDGVRIAQLLASELIGDGDALATLRVRDADPDAEPTTQGTLAYRVLLGDAGDADDDRGGNATRPLAEVFVHPDRARVEFAAAPDAAAAAAGEAGLRVRPKAVTPPRTVVFVEDGAQVKRALSAFRAVVNAGAA